MSIYTDLAKKTVKMYLQENKLPDVKSQVKELLSRRAGCFVSLHKKANDELRGCIGTIVPVYKNLAGEIIANAIEAAFRDPRFAPVTADELDGLKFSVDVLGEPEEIDNPDQLDPKRFGVIVKALDGRSGLLLPNLDGIDNTQQQLDIARQKAGIDPNEKITLYRFRSQRYE